MEEQNIFSGLVYCLDCGAPWYYTEHTPWMR